MLNRIPILDHAPDESYEPTPQLGWFVNKSDKMFPPSVLYQLWQSDTIGKGQVWVKVETFNRPNDD